MKEWRGASSNVHGCKNVWMYCMYERKSIKHHRVASGHQTFHFLIILAHRNLPAQMAKRIKFGVQIMNQMDFFLVRAASLFTLRTFGAQINWRVISRKVLFDPHRFLSNKSPIHFAGESGKGNMFLSGKRHVQNENGHRSPRSQTYAQQL